MHNIRHFYYQNKEKIWKVILIIAFVLGIIYFMNMYETKKNEEKILASKGNLNYYDESSKTYISETTAISGKDISQKEVTKINNTITAFIRYCKEGEYNQAYNMLSENCKATRYNTLEKFTELYAKTKFNKNQTYSVQKWEEDTYKIDIEEDKLITGNVNSTEKIVEYITLEEQEGEEKLNINSYIGKQIINKQETQKNVKIKAIEKHIYMDYEEYTFEIENLSNKTIKIDSLENTGTIYLKDKSGNKYKARMHEILNEESIIKQKQSIKLNIKFSNSYTSSRKIKNITFNNVILDYIEYEKLQDKETFNEICSITIDI